MASAQVTITQLPAAGPLTGNESVPIVQNGQTVQTTTGAIAVQPTQTQTFLTVEQEPSLQNSQYLAVSSGLSLTDNGPQGTLQVNLTGTAASLNASGNGLIAKTATNTITPRAIEVGTGLTIANGNAVSANPLVGLGSFLTSIQTLSGSTGLVGVSGGNATARAVAGTSNQISVANGDASAGNPTVAIASNPVLPGAASVTLPSGSTGDRPSPAFNGMLRYNTTTQTFEGYANGAWGSVTTGTGVTSVGLVMPSEFTVTNSPVTSAGDLTAAWASQTANYIFAAPNGSSGTPTFRAMVAADVPTLNQNTTGQAGSVANAVTFNNGGTGDASGTSFNGAAARTISYNTVGAPSTSGSGASGTWAIDISGTSATATNIAGGASNRIAYQTNTGTTGFITAPSSANYFLQWSGSAFQWASVTGTLSYQGGWNASTNTPTLASGVGTSGNYYVVTVAGNTNLDGITDWLVGDWAIFNGTAWQKIDQTNTVSSVNGYTGAVTLAYSDVGAPSTSGTNATGTWGISISGTAATATNIAGGALGSIPYQTGSGATSLLGIGTSTYMLTSSGSAPQWTNPSSITVGSATSATTSTNLAGGIASQIPYQTGAGATSFIANGTAGQVLTSAGTSAPAWGGINGGTF